MPMKPVKRGYKVWCLANSTTGYICKFDIYTGKSDTAEKELGLGKRVVLNMASAIQRENCVLAIDNFFTSVLLMKKARKTENSCSRNCKASQKRITRNVQR